MRAAGSIGSGAGSERRLNNQTRLHPPQVSKGQRNATSEMVKESINTTQCRETSARWPVFT